MCIMYTGWSCCVSVSFPVNEYTLSLCLSLKHAGTRTQPPQYLSKAHIYWQSGALLLECRECQLEGPIVAYAAYDDS